MARALGLSNHSLLICTCIKNYPIVPNDLTGGYRIEYRVGMVGRLLYFETNWDTLLAYPIRWSGFSLVHYPIATCPRWTA